MKKLVLVLAVLLCAAPAIATDVTITAVAGPGPNDVTVGFTTANVTELVRAIALDVILDDPNVVISDINCVNADYGIYPGSISIDASGNVTNWGTCAGAGLDSNTVATEQGSLYADGDPLPAQSGDLFIITLDGCTSDGSEDVVVSITEDAFAAVSYWKTRLLQQASLCRPTLPWMSGATQAPLPSVWVTSMGIPLSTPQTWV
jgi:hypothetical protein